MTFHGQIIPFQIRHPAESPFTIIYADEGDVFSSAVFAESTAKVDELFDCWLARSGIRHAPGKVAEVQKSGSRVARAKCGCVKSKGLSSAWSCDWTRKPPGQIEL